MLCWMLRECGFKVTPALVSTMLRGRISDHLPAPIFDHVVVHLAHDGKEYWIDPTDISQRGSLADWTSLPFQKALLISDDTTDFLTIKEAPIGKNVLLVDEEYTFPGDGCHAEIKVMHTYRGTQADQARHALDSQGRIAVQQIFTDIVKSTRPKAELLTDMEVTDDTRANVITLQATFSAPDTLTRNPAAANLITEFAPHSINGKLTGLDDKTRRHPLGLIHPVEVKHSTVLRHPDSKGAVVPKVMIDNEFIKFVAGTDNTEELPVLSYHYLTKASEIPVKDLDRYRVNLRQISGVISLSFQTNGIKRGVRSKSASVAKSSWEDDELNPRVARQRSYSGGSRRSSGSGVPRWVNGIIVITVIKIITFFMTGM
jgi:hypothetical protein